MTGLFSGYRISTALVVATLSLLVVAPTAFAQRNPPPTTVERRIDQLNRQSTEYERDSMSRDLKGKGSASAAERQRALELRNQIRADLEGLQAGYNKIVIAMASKTSLDHEVVLGAVDGIKKCSNRLKNNLALPKAKADEEKKSDSVTSPVLEESLLSLRKHVYSFVTSPVFDAPAVLDIEQARRASGDLDKIIQLSDSIKKTEDRAKKMGH